ncbi:UNVERIFIED_CONTAM: Histone-lysine N-methyltransferase SETMAR [Trichonephila clavipes]
MLSAENVFLHDNACPYATAATQDLLDQSGWEIFDHPSDHQYFAPSDYHFFPKLKEFLNGKRFGSDEEL